MKLVILTHESDTRTNMLTHTPSIMSLRNKGQVKEDQFSDSFLMHIHVSEGVSSERLVEVQVGQVDVSAIWNLHQQQLTHTSAYGLQHRAKVRLSDINM